MMNALKYLAVDRSLDAKKPVAGRFQMKESNRLPKFTPADRGGSSTVPEPMPVVGGPKPAVRRSMWRKFVGWVGRSGGEPEGTCPAEVQPELRSPPAPSTSEKATKASVTPESGRARRGPFRVANPFRRDGVRPVQAEFRFENVKVVCNDLSDTDFIVKPRTNL